MKPWRKVLCLLLTLPVCVALYTLLHIGGHGLAVTLLGGSITALDPFDLTAALRYEGVVNTAIVDAAGLLLPLLVALMLLLTRPRERAFGFMTAVEGLYVWGTCLSLLMWVLLPLLGLLAPSFAKGDSAQFVLASGIPAPLVALGAALLLVGLLILSKRTGFFDPLAEEMPRLRTAAKAIPIVFTLVMTIAAVLTLFQPSSIELTQTLRANGAPTGLVVESDVVTIPQDGTYSVYSKATPNMDGNLIGLAFKDADDATLFVYTGATPEVCSAPLKLKAGKYKAECTLMSDQSEWIAYLQAHGLDPNGSTEPFTLEPFSFFDSQRIVVNTEWTIQRNSLD